MKKILIIIVLLLMLIIMIPKIKDKKRKNREKLKEIIDNAVRLDINKYDYNNEYHNFMMANDYKITNLPKYKKSLNYKFDKSIVLVSTIRNCRKNIKMSLNILNLIGTLFKNYSIVLYENNSNDKTNKYLNYEINNSNHITLESENYNIENYKRTIRLARGRNICLNIAKRLDPYYYCVFDFDGVNNNLTKKKITDAININKDWDVITANQNRKYYDIWALRSHNYLSDYGLKCNFDYWDSRPIIGASKLQRIIKENEIIEVDSAFGGFGIYKMNSLKNCFYYGYKNEREHCEHVHLHKQMKENDNANIYIVGSLINH